MDAFAGLLDGPRARNAYLLRTILDPPWSIRVEDRSPLTLLSVVRGAAWIMPQRDRPVRVDTGDTAVVVGPEPYVLADDPETPVDVIVYAGQRCTSLDGEPLAEKMSLGVRTWGKRTDGETVLLLGAYESLGEIGVRLLRALPPLVVLPSDEWACPYLPLLVSEMERDEAGQEAVLDRLIDLILVALLRAWFARPEADPPAWYRAQADPVVGRALQLIHNNPQHPWTVTSVAAETGMSRAALARRFSDLVGEPPMSYLTSWRLALAADLLRDPDSTIGSIARKVGYASPFALSAAFKRVHGVSPQEYRSAAAPAR
jgi:AraC-like DNA-binding protein